MELRKGRILVLLALCALMLGVSAAQAQVTYQITSTPTFVINTGRAEVVGSVRITAINTGPTIASTIQFLYQGVSCDNTPATGISLTTGAAGVAPPSGVFAGVAVFSATTPVANTSAGCVVAITVPGGLVPAVGDYIEIGGVRGRIDFLGGITNVGQNVFASLSATPSNSSLFTAPSSVVIAITAVGLQVGTITQSTALLCTGAGPNPAITVTEGFNGAFVMHVTGSGPVVVPANPRPVFGGINNTQIQLVLAGVPTGVTVTWPTTVAANAPTPAFVAGTVGAGSQLVRLTTSTAATQNYEYQCGDQALCDISQESFTISPTVAVAATAAFGTGTITARLWPGLITGDATVLTDRPFGTAAETAFATSAAPARPRFNETPRPSPPANFVSNSTCATNLLFPWLVNIANFDSGVAIANTSLDPFTALLPAAAGTVAQGGTCTLTGWRNTDATSVSFTTANVAAGTTVTLVLSDPANAVFNGFAGYVIARCNFQYAHGFAFLVENPSAPRVAEGYLALVIPDPVIINGCVGGAAGRLPQTAGSRDPVAGIGCANEGEGLNN